MPRPQILGAIVFQQLRNADKRLGYTIDSGRQRQYQMRDRIRNCIIRGTMQVQPSVSRLQLAVLIHHLPTHIPDYSSSP